VAPGPGASGGRRRLTAGRYLLAGELGRRFRGTHGRLGVADLVIAATAQQLRFPLATLSVRHFPMFPGLEPAYRR
jgi:predicted nucleic acid-binding protein